MPPPTPPTRLQDNGAVAIAVVSLPRLAVTLPLVGAEVPLLTEIPPPAIKSPRSPIISRRRL